MESKVVLITQARTGSTRLPGKVLKEIDGKSLLRIHLERLHRSESVSDIVVATTTSEDDEKIYDLAKEWGFDSYRGSEEDVLDRYYQAARQFDAEWVVRVTSDCPLLDAELVDEVITFAKENDADYVSNSVENKFPDGQDVEVFKFTALEKAWKMADKKSEREHVTPYIRNNATTGASGSFKILNFPADQDFSDIRMTVDEAVDMELISRLINDLGTDCTWTEYANYIIDNNLVSINKHIQRNEGFLKSLKGDKK